MNVIFISFKTPLPPPLLHRGKPYPVPPTTTKYKNIPTIHSSAFNSKNPTRRPSFQCSNVYSPKPQTAEAWHWLSREKMMEKWNEIEAQHNI